MSFTLDKIAASGTDKTTPCHEHEHRELPEDPEVSWRPSVQEEIEQNKASLASEGLAETTPAADAERRAIARAADPDKPHPDREGFLLKQVIAQGGHGEIWEAIQVSLNRTIAVKKIRNKWYEHVDPSTPKFLETSFHKEALVTGRLDHPTIVPVYDLGADKQGRPLLAMKLVQGTEWTRILKADRELDVANFLARHIPTLIAVSHAVAFAHSRGIIHRDLKPSQVMVGRFGEVFLMDWGLAVLVDGAPADAFANMDPAPTHARDAVCPAGTICFMSPEQTENNGMRLGTWTDVFLLGGILYYIITGTYPYPERDTRVAFERAALYLLDTPEARAPDKPIPAELSRIAMKAMAKEPGDRHASVQDFIHELEAFLAGTHQREEARQLVATSETMLAEKEVNYSVLSEIDTLLARSLNLWAENHQAIELQQRAFSRFVELAIEQGDLGLAERQNTRIASESQRLRYQQDIAIRAAAIKRHAVQRRVALIVTLILVIGIGFLGYVLLHVINQTKINRESAALAEVREQTLVQAEEAKALAEKQRAEVAEKLRRLHESERILTTQLSEELRDEYGMPPTLVENPYDRELWRRRDKQTILERKGAAREIMELRSSLAAQIPLPAMPYQLLLGMGFMELHEGQPENLLGAYDLFRLATQEGENRYRATLGMAIAAFRMDNLTSAARHLDDAALQARIVSGFRQDHQRILTLITQLAAKQAEGFTLTPDDILIEARPGGRNHDRYREISGPWAEANKPHEWAKSFAVGSTTRPEIGSRRYRFATENTLEISTEPVTARFFPMLDSARAMTVYVTWPISANAAPVYYNIKHADGITTHAIVQDGWRYHGTGNANKWIRLGEYRFSPGPDQYVELETRENVRPISQLWNGQVEADGVLFATQPLPPEVAMEATAYTSDFESTIIPWNTTLDQAMAQVKDDSTKPLLLYIYMSGSAHTDEMDLTVWEDQSLRKLVAENFIPVRLTPVGNNPEAWKYRRVPYGTLYILDAQGNELGVVSPTESLDIQRLRASLQKYTAEAKP